MMPEYDEEVHGDKYDYSPAAVESPVDWVVNADAANARINNPDDVVGLCTECKSTFEPSVMQKDIFAQEGVPPCCRYCGGVMTIAFRERVEANKISIDRARNIDYG